MSRSQTLKSENSKPLQWIGLSYGLIALSLSASATTAFAEYPDRFVLANYERSYTALSPAQVFIPQYRWMVEGASIGFDFNLFGRDFQRLHIGTRGAITFAQTCDRSCPQFGEICDLPSFSCVRDLLGVGLLGAPYAPQSILAAYWDDLDLATNPLPTSIRYRQEGRAPNRSFIVEWSNMIHHQAVPNQPRTQVSFQARLYEPNSLIELHYGPMSAQSDKTVWFGQIGVEDHTGTKVFRPIECQNGNQSCDWETLAELQNRVLLFGAYDGPELIGSVQSPSGARSQDDSDIPITVRNIGSQSTNLGFQVDLFLEETNASTVTSTLLGSFGLSALDANSSITATLSVTMPTLTSSSAYVLKGVVDAAAVISEGAIQNNGFRANRELNLRENVRSDLRNATLNPAMQALRLEFDIQNEGPAIENLELAFYSSSDWILDSGDTLIANISMNLPAVPLTRSSTVIATPAQFSSGQYILLVADPQDQIAETNESDNISFFGPVRDQPELLMSVESNHSAEVGFPLLLELQIQNSGSWVDGTDWEVRFSRDTVLDAADPIIASGRIALNGARDYFGTFSTQVPVILHGAYNVFAIIDPLNTHAESNEGNNVSMDAHQTHVEGIDIIPHLPVITEGFYRGTTATVSAVFRNRWASRTPPFEAQLLLSDNNTLTLTDDLVSTIVVPSLGPHEELRLAFHWQIPGGQALRQYYLGVIADSQDVIVEDNEVNNAFVLPNVISVQPNAPDFEVGPFASQGLVRHADRFSVARELINRGLVTGQCNYEIYLSSDLVFDPTGDFRVYEGQAQIGAQQRQLDVDQAQIPVNVRPGRYFVLYVIDRHDSVLEIDELNNIAFSSNTIEILDYDLHIQSLSLPNAVVDHDYRAQLFARPEQDDLLWQILDGLPAGLTLHTQSGEIRGKPKSAGHFTFSVEASSSLGRHQALFTIDVAASNLAFKILTPSLPLGQAGRAYDHQLIAQSGIPTLNWTTESVLPAGFSLSAQGRLFGTPTEGSIQNIIITVNDSSGHSKQASYLLRIIDDIDAFRFAAKPIPTIRLQQSFSFSFEFENVVRPITLAVESGTLPEGLAINGLQLHGTATELRSSSLILRATDASGASDDLPLLLEISPSMKLQFLPAHLPLGSVNEAYRFQITVDASDAQFKLIHGAMPPGLALESEGLITGTSSRSGVFDFMVSATGARGEHAIEAMSILMLEAKPKIEQEKGCGCATSNTASSQASLLIIVFLLAIQGTRRRYRA